MKLKKIIAGILAMILIVTFSPLGNLLDTEEVFAATKLSKVTSLVQKAPYSTTSITMSWKKHKDATGYEVYRSTSVKGKYTKVKTTTSTSYKQGKLTRGKTYYYKVRAYKMVNGNKVNGSFSSVKAMGTKPQTPSLKVYSGVGKAKVAWNKISGISGYEVYMSSSKTGTYTRIKTVGSKTTEYLKKGLTGGKEYFFKVKSYRTVGGKRIYSSWSSIKSVKVKKTSSEAVKVTGVNLNKTTVTLNKGATTTLTATVAPSNANNKFVSWSSSNTSVATVSNGKVTAVGRGTATITVKTKDGGKIATCKVKVNEPDTPSTHIAVTGVELNFNAVYNMPIGESTTLVATVNPSNATNKSVTWSSSDKSVATVNNGLITAVSCGQTEIKVRTVDGGKEAVCYVSVYDYNYEETNDEISVTGITLNKTSVTLNKGGSTALTATVTPSNATNKSVIWSSSDTSIATISDGKVNAIGKGTAIITAKTLDGNHTATCKVTVNVPVTSVSLNKSSVTLNKGGSTTLTATVAPSDATNKSVIWSSSNTSVATVSNGIVKAAGKGTATITVKTVDGSKTATCAVTVTDINTFDPSTCNWLVEWNKAADTDSGKIRLGLNYSGVDVDMPDYATVRMRDATGTEKHHWKFVKNGTSGYMIYAKMDSNSNCVLAINKGSDGQIGIGDTVCMSPSASQDAYLWDLYRISSGSYIIKLRNTNYALTIGDYNSESGYEGWNLSLQTFSESNTKQQFNLNKAVTSITMSGSSKLSLDLGTTTQLKLSATFAPSDAYDKNLIWSSSDVGVATIDKNGLITGIKSGTTTIKVISKDGGYEVSKKLYVYRSNSDTAVGDVKLVSNLSDTLRMGLVYGSVTDSMPDNCIVRMRNVTGSTKHHWYISAKSDGSGYTVKAIRDTDKNCVLAINKGSNNTINAGDIVYMSSNATSDIATWIFYKLYDGSYAIILKGTSYALTIGSYEEANEGNYIELRTFDLWNTNQHFNIRNGATGISVSTTSVSVAQGATKQVTATVLPDYAYVRDVLWSSSNESVATVSSTGVIKGVGIGSATITATSADGGYKKTIAVSVTQGYIPRFTAPVETDKYYFSDNNFYWSGLGLPNCTAYAYGRAYEILGTKANLCTQGDAGDWWSYNINNGYYSYGSTPKLGAIMCWGKSSYPYDHGHVAVVEQINSDGTIVISESQYGGVYFRTITINSNGSYFPAFQGYIYIR